MGKMSWIAYLANKGMLKELSEEVGLEMAKGFIEAAKTIEHNKDTPAYKNLSKIQKEMVEHAGQKRAGDRIAKKIKENIDIINSASVGIRDEY